MLKHYTSWSSPRYGLSLTRIRNATIVQPIDTADSGAWRGRIVDKDLKKQHFDDYRVKIDQAIQNSMCQRTLAHF